jgi:hypothetical protein
VATVMAAARVPKIEVSVAGNVKVEMQRAADKRDSGKRETHNEADQIKKFPIHGFTSRLASLSFIFASQIFASFSFTSLT